MNAREVMSTASMLVVADKVVVAFDESTPTCNARSAVLEVGETEESRLAYRGMSVSTPGLGGCIRGCDSLPRRWKVRRHDVREDLATLSNLAPEHMHASLPGIDAVTAAFPAVPRVAAFDTAFHATIPEAAAGHGLPFEWTER